MKSSRDDKNKTQILYGWSRKSSNFSASQSLQKTDDTMLVKKVGQVRKQYELITQLNRPFLMLLINCKRNDNPT